MREWIAYPIDIKELPKEIEKLIQQAKQEGRKEVVDYIKSEGDWDTGLFIFGFAIDADIWNAKLKEWGLTPD